jgi:hypothetical protein
MTLILPLLVAGHNMAWASEDESGDPILTPDGSAEHPYVIGSKDDWDWLVTMSLTDSFVNKHFELTNDINSVTMPVANTPDHPFCGHIDGKGHKVTLALESGNAVQLPAMISFAGEGCTVENLSVNGTITMTGGMNGAGFIARAAGDVTLTNCRSSITLTYTNNYGTPYNGGFIGQLKSGATATLSRCLFDGAFISSTAATFGGMVSSGGNITINNSVVVTASSTSLTSTVNNDNSAFVYQAPSTNWSNNYYVYDETGSNHLNGTINRYKNNLQPQAYQITPNNGVTAAHSGTGLTIGNGTATLYSDGFSYDGKEYFPFGTTVTLGNTPDEGMTCVGYSSNDISISGEGTFSMPRRVVNVTAHYVRTDYVNHWQASRTRDGSTEAKAYLISTPDGLNLLASEVNGGYSFQGKYFKLDADIAYSYTTAWDDDASTESNYTPIGKDSINGFKGRLDGQNHTVSGIRIIGVNGSDVGIIGFLGYDAVIKNFILTDTRIAGANNVAGFVGLNYGFINNCHVRNNVSITTAGELTDGQVFGGIVGTNNSSVWDCTVAGAVIANGNMAGAIVGRNDPDATLSGNTYHSCLVGENAFNIGVGYHGQGGTSSGEHGDRTGASLDPTQLWLSVAAKNKNLLIAYSDELLGDNPHLSSIDVTLQGYTLFKDGTWNMLCPPFNLRDFTGTPLAGASVYKFNGDGSSLDTSTGTLTAAFSPVTSLKAGQPYLVKWSGTSGQVENPCFSGVKTITWSAESITSSDSNFRLIGQDAPLEIEDGNKHRILFLDSGNRLGYSQTNRTLPAFGAYFWVYPNTMVNKVIVDFGDGSGVFFLSGRLSDGVYWTTYYNPNTRFTLAPGATAFTLGTDHKLYRLGSDGRVIPAGVAVVILSNVADIELTSSSDESPVAIHGPEGNNILQGSGRAMSLSYLIGTPYVLGIVGGVLGFYPYTGSEIPANKAFYGATINSKFGGMDNYDRQNERNW